MTCAETLNTQAFIDGAITGDEATIAERHIEGCAECQAFCADAAALSDDIRTLAVRYRAPPGLHERVARTLDEEAARQSAPRETSKTFGKSLRKRPEWRGFWFGAFGGAGFSGLIGVLVVLAILPPSAATLVDKVTDAHTSALMAGRQIQVVSNDHHTVKPWFAGRIALSPPVTDFAAQGFKLTGGRLDLVAGAPAAVVVYQHGRHEIDLFVWVNHGGGLPAAGLRHGYHSLFWQSRDLDFAAVSDTAPAELSNFATLIRSQPE